MKRKSQAGLPYDAGAGLRGVAGNDLCAMIIGLFDRLRSLGTSETHAVQAAVRVFGYHEPGIRTDLATAIVEGLTFHRDVDVGRFNSMSKGAE